MIKERPWAASSERAVAESHGGEPLAAVTWLREPPHPGEELASYRVSAGERLLLCARGPCGLEIHDVDATSSGKSYRVDHLLEDPTALAALVADYLRQAKRLDAPPMSADAIAAAMRID